MSDDDDLKTVDAMLDTLAAQEARLPEGLSARIVADAARVQAGFAAGPVTAKPAGRPSGLVRDIWAGLGGWSAFGSLVAASVAGFWLGLAPPAALDGVSEALGLGTADIPVTLYTETLLPGQEG